MAEKFLNLVSGKVEENEGLQSSTGAADAGKIPALDGAGKLDISMMPTGIGADVAVLTATENLSAGDYVNIHSGGVRLADNSNGRDAHGFVKAVVTSGSPATVYFEGANDSLTSLTVGARYYLGTAGGATATPPTSAGGAQIHQFLGIAISTTAVNTDMDDCIKLI